MEILFLLCTILTNAFGLHLNKFQSLYFIPEYSPGKSLRVRRDTEILQPVMNVSASPEIIYFHIHSDIRYRYAKTVISSEIHNTLTEDHEVTFQAIIPETAFISKFIMEVDGKIYRGRVRPKEEAKDIYEKAKGEGNFAGILGSKYRNTNIFNLNINIGPGSIVKFNLWHEELLQRKYGYYQHQVNFFSETMINIKDFKIEVMIQESQDIKSLLVRPILNEFEREEMGSNNLAVVKIQGGMAHVIWRDDELFDKSIFNQSNIGKFILHYDVHREGSSSLILLLKDYFVHFFVPEINIKPLRKHVVYVLDTSASMAGRRIEQLRSAMLFALDDLKTDDYFNIITFSANVYIWRPNDVYGDRLDPIKVNEEKLEKADTFIRRLEAEGGTFMSKSLTEALNVAARGRKLLEEQHIESIIIFLTDGEPTIGITKPHQIINAVHKANQMAVPIYSLAFGTGADFNFLKKLSLQNYGFAKKIFDAEDADIQLKGFYAEISTPLLSLPKFKYTSGKGSDYDRRPFEISRDRFRNVFKGTEMIITGKFPVKEGYALNAEISADGRDGRIYIRKSKTIRIKWTEWPYPWTSKTERLALPEDPEFNLLERHWSYFTIQQLIERDTSESKEIYLYPNEVSHSGVIIVNPRRKASKLAVKYEFVTPYTFLSIIKPDNSSEEIAFYPKEKLPVPTTPRPVVVTTRSKSAPPPDGKTKILGKLPKIPGSKLGTIPQPQIMNGPTPPPTIRDESESDLAHNEANEGGDDGTISWELIRRAPTTTRAPIRSKDDPDISLRDIVWLNYKRTIWIDSTQYKVLISNSIFESPDDPPKEVAASCIMKNNGRTGKCVHLANCVNSEYLNDKEIYVKNFFCSISFYGETYAGSCCEKGLNYTH